MSAPEPLMLVIPTLNRGGAERVAARLSREWARDHAVTVVCFDAGEAAYPVGGELVVLGLPATASRVAKGLALARRVSALAREIRVRRPRRIIAFMEGAGFAAVAAALDTGTLGALTVSVRVHPSVLPAGYRLGIGTLYRLPARVVAVSQGVRSALVDGYGLSRERCVAIPNPLDLEAIAAACARAPTPPAPDAPFVLAAGRLDRQKGFDVLIAAFARLPHSGTRLVILGEGGDRAALLAQARALGIAERVMLPGAVADPWPWMARADVFALPSRVEGWPNALAEAMACGAPVVAADCPSGPREIIAHGRNGLLVPVEDVDALAAALQRLLGDRAAARALGDEARAWAHGYAVARIAPRWLEGLGSPSTSAARDRA
jgi:glycosyltransferase involved in cell wall biosynthesis